MVRRQALYSGSRRTPGGGRGATYFADTPVAPTPPPSPNPRFPRLRALGTRNAGFLRFLGGAACAVLIAVAYLWSQPRPPALSQEDIDAAVLHTLENKMLPARAAKAAEMVRPAVVRVNGFGDPAEVKGTSKGRSKRPPHKFDPGASGKQADADKGASGMKQIALGSGVVIVDDGTILTNLHVVLASSA